MRRVILSIFLGGAWGLAVSEIVDRLSIHWVAGLALVIAGSCTISFLCVLTGEGEKNA